MVRNIALDGRLHPMIPTLTHQGSIPPRTALLDDHDQTSSLHLLTQILMKVFSRPRIGPLAQYVCRYVLLGLSPLQLLYIYKSKKISLLLIVYHIRQKYFRRALPLANASGLLHAFCIEQGF